MRQNFANFLNKRSDFIGTFAKVGIKLKDNGEPEKTYCFENIIDIQNCIKESHIWFNDLKSLNKLNLKIGDTIKFKATVKEYKKYCYKIKGLELKIKTNIDYKLSNPSKIIKIIGVKEVN